MEHQQPVVNGKAMVRRSEEEILKHLADQEKSGFTVKEYCEMYDIVEQAFYTWLKKYRTKAEEGFGGFAQIELVPVSTGRPQLFAEVGNIRLYKEVPAEYLKALLS